LFRGLHAEAAKRGLDHDGLRDVCRQSYGVHSMGEVSDADLVKLYKSFTGKGLRTRARLPKRGEARDKAVEQMVSGEDLTALDSEFAKRSMGADARRNFVRRQLRGRDRIVTRRDYARVFHGLRAMNRREGL
jgi:hypothetical protein